MDILWPQGEVPLCSYKYTLLIIFVAVFQKLEPFMTGCRSAAKLAMGVMQQFTSSKLGETIQECKNLLEQHHQKIKDVFEDSRLSALQVEGEQILIRLQEDEAALPKVPDYIETVNCVTKLYHQMNEVFCKLELLTDNRTRKLEQCLALKEFEKDLDEVKHGKLIHVWKTNSLFQILNGRSSRMQKVSDCISQWKDCASLCLTQIVIFEFLFEIYLGKGKNTMPFYWFIY